MSKHLGNEEVDPSLPSGSNNGTGGERRGNNKYFVFNRPGDNQTGVNTEDGNGYAGEDVNRHEGFRLTDAQKEILVDSGFDIGALDKMCFPSYKEAYDWCGEQMRSPRKRRVSEPRGETSDTTPRKRIPLTQKQKWLISPCGRSKRELDEMRFDTVQEGYRWVGDVLRENQLSCEPDSYDTYDEEEGYDDFDDEDDFDEEDAFDEEGDFDEDSTTEESFLSENVISLDGVESEGRTLSLEDDSSDTEKENEVVPAELPSTRPVDLTNDVAHGQESTPINAKNKRIAEQPLCGICFEPMGGNTDRQMSAGKCGHVYCLGCLQHTVGMQKKCPSCNKRMGLRSIRKIYLDT